MVKLALLERRPRDFRRFEGPSSLATYLTIVIQRRLSDQRKRMATIGGGLTGSDDPTPTCYLQFLPPNRSPAANRPPLAWCWTVGDFKSPTQSALSVSISTFPTAAGRRAYGGSELENV